MTRLFCVGIMVAALLFAVPALASVPTPENCTVAWYNGITTGVIGICPSADYSGIDVTVMDQFNQPVGLMTVTVTFADTRVLLQTAAAGPTNSSGYVRIMFDGGLNAIGSSTCVSSAYTVTCLGVTIGSGTVKILSPDYDGSWAVGPADFGQFALDWQTSGTDLRSDFAWDGSVGPGDFGQFALHWGD